MSVGFEGMCFAIRAGKLVPCAKRDLGAREMNCDVRPGFFALVTSWRSDEKNLRIVSVASGTRTTRLERDELERAMAKARETETAEVASPEVVERFARKRRAKNGFR